MKTNFRISQKTCAVMHELRLTFPGKVRDGQHFLLCWPCSLVNNLEGESLHTKFRAAGPESAVLSPFFSLNCQFCVWYQTAPLSADGRGLSEERHHADGSNNTKKQSSFRISLLHYDHSRLHWYSNISLLADDCGQVTDCWRCRLVAFSRATVFHTSVVFLHLDYSEKSVVYVGWCATLPHAVKWCFQRHREQTEETLFQTESLTLEKWTNWTSSISVHDSKLLSVTTETVKIWRSNRLSSTMYSFKTAAGTAKKEKKSVYHQCHPLFISYSCQSGALWI